MQKILARHNLARRAQRIAALAQITAATTLWAVCQLIPGDKTAVETARFADHVTAVIAEVGVPLRRVLSDNRPEFTGRAFTGHLLAAEVEHARIPPRRPNHNAVCERFQGTALQDYTGPDSTDSGSTPSPSSTGSSSPARPLQPSPPQSR